MPRHTLDALNRLTFVINNPSVSGSTDTAAFRKKEAMLNDSPIVPAPFNNLRQAPSCPIARTARPSSRECYR
jgi:hypothetical protein